MLNMDKQAEYIGGGSWSRLLVGKIIEKFVLEIIVNLRLKNNDKLTSWYKNVRTTEEITDDSCHMKIN